MNKLSKLSLIPKLMLGLAVGIPVLGALPILLTGAILNFVMPDISEIAAVITIISVELIICLMLAFLLKRKKIVRPFLVAMFSGMVISGIILTMLFCFMAYDNHRKSENFRRIAGPIGGPDLSMPKPDTKITEIKIGMLYDNVSYYETPQHQVTCTNTVAIRDLLLVFQKAEKIDDHKCSSEGVIHLLSGEKTIAELEFFHGHSKRYYEYRNGSNAYRMPKAAFFSALSALGYDTKLITRLNSE